MDCRSPNSQLITTDPIAISAIARQRLAIEGWPLQPKDLPAGTALVGGAVRDALLNRLGTHPDLDLVVPSGAIALTRKLAQRFRGSAVVLDAERDMGRLVLGPWNFDIAAREGPDLATDLLRRDYSINALGLPLKSNQPLQDPTGGLHDLQQGQLRAISETNLLADPLRLLRGPRLAAELGFALNPETAALIQSHHACLSQVAPERVLAELEKLAGCSSGDRGLQQVVDLELLKPWLNRLTGSCEPLDAQDLTASERSEAIPLARLSRILDADALEQLRSSRRLQQRCARLRRWALRLDHGPLSESEQLLLCRELEADLPALTLLRNKACNGWMQRWRDPGDPLFHPRPPLDGTTLQNELGLQPGRELGALLEQLMLERAFGRAHDLQAARDLRRD